MRIVLTSRGSRGDVYPIIEIAASLVRSGHSVVMAAPTFFAHRLRDRRVPHRCYSEDTLAVMRGFGSGWGAAKTALDWFSSSVDEQFAVMLEETRNADVLVTSANEIAAPTVAEYRRMPHFRVAYTPLLPGTQPPPLVPWQGLPPEGNRLMWRVLNIGTGLFIRRYIDRWRRRLSLPRMGPVRDYFTGNSHTLLAIHPTLAPPCPTWSGRYRFTYCGHCDGAADGHESSGADEGLDPDLERFLAAEPPPIYVGFGSVHVKHPRRITRMILEATRRSGCRVVIGSGWSGLGQFRPGAHGHRGEVNGPVFVAGETPHSILFERTAGVAHHGAPAPHTPPRPPGYRSSSCPSSRISTTGAGVSTVSVSDLLLSDRTGSP